MPRKLALGLALALGGASLLVGSAEAALSDSAFVAPLSYPLRPFENADFIYNGRQYCWYDDGWRGPGWYWCGYAHWEGAGWGGAYGWNGWSTLHSGGYRRGAPRRHNDNHDGAH
jgi:hypothetical protein